MNINNDNDNDNPEKFLNENLTAKYLEENLYLKAELDNLSKRHLEEKNKITKYAIEDFSKELLTIKESLEFGISTQNEDLTSLKNGMNLTLNQLNAIFTKFGIKELNPINEIFNAYQHQAINKIMHEKPDNTIIEVLRKGYLLNDRLLKPALVVLSNGIKSNDLIKGEKNE